MESQDGSLVILGTCYLGPAGKSKAQKQAKAMFANGYKG